MSENKSDNFFEKQEYLQIKEINSVKREEKIKTSLKDFLSQNVRDNNYKVIWRAVNEMKFGYYNLEGGFVFYDNIMPKEKFLIKLRMFNENEEIMIQKYKEQYIARIIKDNADKNEDGAEMMKVVDDVSTLFGERAKEKLQSDIFVKLAEKRRKIFMIIPASNKADYYALATRSYITFDKKTGQAGYGYYRYLDIRPEVKKS